MRILVLGGTRFIGDRIVQESLSAGHEVLVVHRGVTEHVDAPGGAARAPFYNAALGSGALTHFHAGRADFGSVAESIRARRPDAVVDTSAATLADAEAVLPHLPEVPLVVLSSMDVYRAYELLLSGKAGQYNQPVPLTEDSEVRHGRYPLRGILDGRDAYDKLDVEPGYLARGGTVLRLGAIYGERDPQRREEFVLRRVRAGRTRIPVGAGTWLWTRGYVGDVASAVLAVLGRPDVTSGEIFNVGDLVTDTVRDHARRILDAAGHDAELVTVPDEVVPDDLESTKSTAQHFLCDCGKLARAVGWRPLDVRKATGRSVKWHLNFPPDAADTDFSADDRALGSA